MARLKLWLWGLLIVTFSLIIFSFYFVATDGKGLYRLARYYLSQDIPNKEYAWFDFIYHQDPGSYINGVYAFGDEDSISLWTLSGLKRFYAKPLTSVYVFRDTCGIVRKLTETGAPSLNNPELVSINLSDWQTGMKPEYFVRIKTLGKEDGKNLIDKAWSISGKYKVLGRIDRGVCE